MPARRNTLQPALAKPLILRGVRQTGKTREKLVLFQLWLNRGKISGRKVSDCFIKSFLREERSEQP